PRREALERLAAAGGVGCRRTQQLSQLRGGTRIEPAPCSAGKASDLPEGLLSDYLIALLEHERGHFQHAEFAGQGAEIVDLLLHRVTDKNQCSHAGGGRLAPRLRKYLGDLGVAAAAIDLGHEPRELGAVRNPSRRAAFVEATVVDQADIQTAERGSLAE